MKRRLALLALPLLLAALLWPVAREYRARVATHKLRQELFKPDPSLARVENFLYQGADVNSGYEEGGTALFAAVGHDVAFVKLLLRHGAVINVRAPSGVTPLMVAAREGSVDNVRLLLSEGALVNAQSDYKSTALSVVRHFLSTPTAAYRPANYKTQLKQIVHILKAAGAKE